MPQTKIVVVEDERKIRQELNVLLTNAGYQTVQIDTFLDTAKQIIDADADLVLLDVELPEANGIEICTNVRLYSDVPIIFVTGNNTSMDELNCITMGGDDYISKPYHAPILLARIASLLKRTKKDNKTASSISLKGVTLELVSGKIKYLQEEADLTKNELKVLYYLMTHTGTIVSRVELIEYLWEQQIYLDDNTLSVNMTRIRNKLKELGIVQFIETRRGLGYQIT